MNLIDKLEKDGWLILYGGSDINPSIYGHPNYRSYISNHSIKRDIQEIAEYTKAVKDGRPIFGICRGLQLISALNNLTLIQDMTHGGSHAILVEDLYDKKFNKVIYVNNAHHQLVWTNNELEGDNFKVYGYCNSSPYHHYLEDIEIECKVEPEIIHFPNVKAIGTQFHPEWMSNNYLDEAETLDYLSDLIDKVF